MNRVLRDVMVGAVATVGVGAFTSADAQAPAASAPQPAPRVAQQAQAGGVIRRVVVQGNQRIEPSTITSYMNVRPGDAFDPEAIDTSLKTLFATGLFADVKVEQREQDLVVTVVENPIVSRVIFEGLSSIDEKDLEDEVQARPRSVFTPARAQADVQRIIEVYRRNGHFAASVTPQVRELDQNRVDLIFEVDEGPVTGVRNINFIGNEAFSDRDLRGAIVTTESHWWNFFSSNDNYDPDRLEYDREQLRQYYTNRGYADFRVVSAVAELTPDRKDFYITFTVDEGIQYEFGEVTVQTELDRVPVDRLRAALPIRSGELFKGELVENSIDAMSGVAGTLGYANVDIRPQVDRNRETQKVNITFTVNEGPRVFVERVDIVGNSQTDDDVIRRELRLSEGDAFNRALLDRSRSRVRALGFFKDVTVEEQPGSAPDRSVVRVQVEEQATGELAFAAGYSSSDAFLFDVSISQRNLRGRGQFLRARASASSRRQQLDLRFTEPRFLGRDLAAGFDLYSLRTDFLKESSFENQSTGLGLRASFPVTERTSVGLTYTLVQDDTEIGDQLFDNNGQDDLPAGSGGDVFVDRCDPGFIARPRICDQEGSFLTSLLGYSFNWDRRNDPVSPTGGFDLSISQDWAGLGGDVNYLRTEVSGGAYWGIWNDVVASARVSAGYIFGTGDDQIRINDRFFKGGASFRGFDVAGIGPRDVTTIGTGQPVYGDALGGNAFAITTLQVTFPLGLPEQYGLSGAVFTEFGSLGILDDEAKAERIFPYAGTTYTLSAVDDFSLRASAGVSVFWDSPFGPVQFDFAEPFQKEPYDQTETFRFSTRTRF